MKESQWHFFFFVHGMQSSKMNRNLQILSKRYSQTKQIISLFLLLSQSLKMLFLENQSPNLHGDFHQKYKKMQKNFDSRLIFCLIASHTLNANTCMYWQIWICQQTVTPNTPDHKFSTKKNSNFMKWCMCFKHVYYVTCLPY